MTSEVKLAVAIAIFAAQEETSEDYARSLLGGELRHEGDCPHAAPELQAPVTCTACARDEYLRMADAALAAAERAAWQPIETLPHEWKDGRELDGWDAKMGARSIVRWGKHNHVPLYGWIRQIELYGEEVDGFDPTHVGALREPPGDVP